MTGNALIQARELEVRFGETPVLQGVNVDVVEGREIAVTGRSGCGKTTLLLSLAGLIHPDEGTVRYPGLDPSRQRRAQIGLVFQAPSLVPELTAAENVSVPLRLGGMPLAAARVAAHSALAALGLADAAEALPAQLSGGMQQRVAVARVLAGEARVILADEPTGALDTQHAREVIRLLRDATRRRGGALVLATHDEDLAGLLQDRLHLQGGVLRQGVPA